MVQSRSMRSPPESEAIESGVMAMPAAALARMITSGNVGVGTKTSRGQLRPEV